MVLAVAWVPFAFGGEPEPDQPADEATSSAQAPATLAPGPEAIGQANALRRAGDVEGAIALLRDYAPRNATMRAIKGMTLAAAHVAAEDWESALARYAGVIEAPGGLPSNMVAAAASGAGYSCMELGRHEDAVTHLEVWKRVVKEPQPSVYDLLASAHKALGRHALAIENLEAALRLAEEKARASGEDADAKVVVHYRSELAELRRLLAEQ